MKTLSAVILIVAAAFLWTDRIQVFGTSENVITYDKWTGRVCAISFSNARCFVEIPK
jgi:hypothetical protein